MGSIFINILQMRKLRLTFAQTWAAQASLFLFVLIQLFQLLCGLTKDWSSFLGLLVMRSELVFCHQLRLVILGYLQLSRTALAEIAGTAHCQSDCQYQ